MSDWGPLEVGVFFFGCIGLIIAVIIGETGSTPVFFKRRKK